MAKGALENAAWDAEAEAHKRPLWKLLGGLREELPCGVSIGIQDSPEQLLDKIDTEVNAGYQRIKLKCKPGWDVKILERVRAKWPNITLSVDANSAYTTKDFDHLKTFDQFGLLMIEQPLWNDDFYFHASLQKQIKTAICLDEAIHHARDAQAAVELGSCRIINVKVGRVGGFSEAIAVHDVCRENKIPVWCGGMLETGIGRVHNIALSTLPNFSLPGDVSASKRYWNEDIIQPEVTVSAKGFIDFDRTKPGRGYEIKKDLVEKLTVRKEVVRAGTASA
jgi:O-succinylbenzoate synthase